MKKLVLSFISICLFSTLYGQGIGATLSYSTRGVFSVDLLYISDKNRFHLGYSAESSGNNYEIKPERKPNYGKTLIERGDYLRLLDLGYSRVIAGKITIHPELSIGSRVFYSSYQDKRFSEGGYSLVDRKETRAGIGVNIGYKVTDYIEPVIGFHTLKDMNIGIRFLLEN